MTACSHPTRKWLAGKDGGAVCGICGKTVRRPKISTRVRRVVRTVTRPVRF